MSSLHSIQKRFRCRVKGCPWKGISAVARSNHQRACRYSTKFSVVSRVHKPTSLPPLTVPTTAQKCVDNPAKHLFRYPSNDSCNTAADYVIPDPQIAPKKTVREHQLAFTNAQRERRTSVIDSLSVLFLRLSRKAGSKDVNELLTLLRSEYISTEDIANNFASVRKCSENVAQIVNNDFEMSGFCRSDVTDDNGYGCVMYHRSVNAVIRDQVSSVKRCEIYCTPIEARRALLETSAEIYVPSHPVGAQLGIEVCAAVEEAIKTSSVPGVFWKQGGECNSVVGILQVYSDKSHTTLKASSFVFYPVHLILLNFAENCRNKLIMQGKTILGYLPTTFQQQARAEPLEIISEGKGVSRATRVQLNHKCLSKMFSELNDTYLTGVVVNTSDGVALRVHSVLSSCVADLPEAKDHTAVLNGNNSHRNCHICLTPTSQFAAYTSGSFRTLSQTRELLQRHSDFLVKASISNGTSNHDGVATLRENAAAILSDFSIVPYEPAFASIHQSLRNSEHVRYHAPSFCPYRMFRFEPLHNFHLGITKMLLRLIHSRCRALLTRPSKVLNLINSMLQEVESIYRCADLHVDFSISSKPMHLNGLFVQDGIVGMLEAINMRHVEKLLPFIGCICDRNGNDEASKNAPVTTVMVSYCEVLSSVYRRAKRKWWTEAEICCLRNQIAHFKECASTVLGSYHPSRLATEKFHMLDHIVDDMRAMGSVAFMSGALWEHSHCRFKDMYRSTSKRKDDALHVCVSRTTESLAVDRWAMTSDTMMNLPSWTRRLQSAPAPTITSTAAQAMKTDLPTISRCDKTFSATVLTPFFEIQEGHSSIALLKKSNELIRSAFEDLGEEGFLMFAKEFRQLVLDDMIPSDLSHVRLARPASVHVPSILTPTHNNLEYCDGQPHVHVTESRNRFIYRAVAARNYWNASGLRQDAVMVQAVDCANCEENQKCLWFAVVKCFLSVTVYDRTFGRGARIIKENTFAFVQYFDVVPSVDDIDNATNCIKLSWSRANRDCVETDCGRHSPQRLDPGKWFGLTAVESIVGIFSLVPAEGRPLCQTARTDRSNRTNFHGSLPWYDRYFYVNRFYTVREEAFYTACDRASE